MENESTKSKSDELIERAEANSLAQKEEKVSKTKSKKPAKPKAEKKVTKPKAEKKAPKPKKAAAVERAPRLKLSDKQLAEARETIRVLPAIVRMIEKYGKTKDLNTNEAAEKLIMTAIGRIAALQRYTAE